MANGSGRCSAINISCLGGMRAARPPRACTCAMQLSDAPATPLTYLRDTTRQRDSWRSTVMDNTRAEGSSRVAQFPINFPALSYQRISFNDFPTSELRLFLPPSLSLISYLSNVSSATSLFHPFSLLSTRRRVPRDVVPTTLFALSSSAPVPFCPTSRTFLLNRTNGIHF